QGSGSVLGDFPATYIGGSFFRLWLTVSDFDAVESLIFRAGRQGGLTNHVQWSFNARTASANIGRDGERFAIDLKASEIESVGGNVVMASNGLLEPLTSFTDAELEVTADGGTVELHRLELIRATATQGVVSITFDDGHASVAELAKPKMD